jgi:nicotinate-nucleotide pyrophosphorylase (carboxylating)
MRPMPAEKVSDEVRALVERALVEDVGQGDVTSEVLVPPDTSVLAEVNQKAPGVIFGLAVAGEAFAQAGAHHFTAKAEEGRWREEVPSPIAGASGPARALLAGERVALNFLGPLSGVATLTARFVNAVEGTKAKILDTRKTIPGLRVLEKQAVASGGGLNHRMGLWDAILIKENHIALSKGVRDAVERARRGRPDLPVEVECRTLGELSEAIAGGASRVLLDNMEPSSMDSAVVLARGATQKVELEASGGVSLHNVRRIAETGVDYISVGALTHSAPALDLSMLIKPV